MFFYSLKRPVLYLLSLQKHTALFHLVFSLSTARFFQDGSLFHLSCRQLEVLLSPRSLWCLSSRDFTVRGKPDRPVCLQHGLAAAAPRPSTCSVAFTSFHGDWSPSVRTSGGVSPPSWAVAKTVHCIRPRRHCHTSTADITHCQKMLSCHVNQWLCS